MNKARIAVLVVTLLALGAGIGSLVAVAATGDQLVYICADTQGHLSNCVNGQELEVFDRNGAPIWSVGETGGDAVFGDNRSVYRPGSVSAASVVESYTDPATYNRTFGRPNTCVAPAIWIAPHGIWACSNGAWGKRISF